MQLFILGDVLAIPDSSLPAVPEIYSSGPRDLEISHAVAHAFAASAASVASMAYPHPSTERHLGVISGRHLQQPGTKS